MTTSASSPGPAPAPTPAPRRGTLALVSGGMFGMTGVSLSAVVTHLPDGAFAPHGREMAWHAVWMQMWHAPVLVALGLAMRVAPGLAGRRLGGAALGLGFGTLLFCVSVYALAFGLVRHAPLAPWGGTIVIASWLWLTIGALRRAPHG